MFTITCPHCKERYNETPKLIHNAYIDCTCKACEQHFYYQVVTYLYGRRVKIDVRIFKTLDT